ncbi:Protein of unknown function [Pyronema omphalodes CBS 100304]|uniref:Uncharacterized protein n=1 Tax=Pyronema omphalodes (strain CBS 100304) TaxID=1076935 RepID=U4LBS6_PYROM|nr:Protein of unknown function [Pyronema omphalodes CBS 100304]
MGRRLVKCGVESLASSRIQGSHGVASDPLSHMCAVKCNWCPNESGPSMRACWLTPV